LTPHRRAAPPGSSDEPRIGCSILQRDDLLFRLEIAADVAVFDGAHERFPVAADAFAIVIRQLGQCC
jgi:hypothetical protein